MYGLGAFVLEFFMLLEVPQKEFPYVSCMFGAYGAKDTRLKTTSLTTLVPPLIGSSIGSSSESLLLVTLVSTISIGKSLVKCPICDKTRYTDKYCWVLHFNKSPSLSVVVTLTIREGHPTF